MNSPQPVRPSAKTAITIIKNVADAHSAECAAFFVGPNMILTLSGARMYGDGVFYHPNSDVLKKWKREIDQGLQCIQSHAQNPFFSEIYPDSVRNSDLGNVVYELYNIEGFVNTASLYSFLNPELYTPLLEAPSTGKKPYQDFLTAIGKISRFKKYKPEQIMDIAFGVYLGYPEKAILESLKFWDDSEGKFAGQEVNANIQYANYYSCPLPVYTYPRELIQDPTIMNHEKLWSDILQEFYSSDLHKQLQKDTSFMATIEEIGKY